MWVYGKTLEYPVHISKTDVKMAKLLITQYGGPDGELSAALQYLNQRYSMTDNRAKALLTDIGTEELAHLEIIAAMIFQLIKNASEKEIKSAGLWYTQHGKGLFYTDSNGVPWSAGYISTSGDPVADISSDIAAELRSIKIYERLINLADDPDIVDVLKFLREREIVHLQRFKELLNLIQTK